MPRSEVLPLTARATRRDRRGLLFAAAIAGSALVLCAIAVLSSSAQGPSELTELPDGKSYMMSMLRDRVRALSGHGEGHFDHVMRKSQDNEISKIYGSLDKESPHVSLSARFEQATGSLGPYNLPALNVAPVEGDDSTASLVEEKPSARINDAALSEDPDTRRAAQLESDHAFKLYQTRGEAFSASSEPILLETGAQPIPQQQQQVLQQLPPVAPAAPIAPIAPGVAEAAQPPQYAPYAPPYQAPQYQAPQYQQQPPPTMQQPQPYGAPPQYQPYNPNVVQQPVADQSDGGLLAPSFVSPPTPEAPIEVGCAGVSFMLQALGLHSGDTVSITMMEGAPLGCSLTQQTVGVNPASAVFTWTPSRPEYNSLQNQVCFIAEDSHHLTRSKCVSLDLNPQCAASAPIESYPLPQQYPYPAAPAPIQQPQYGAAPVPQQPAYNPYPPQQQQYPAPQYQQPAGQYPTPQQQQQPVPGQYPVQQQPSPYAPPLQQQQPAPYQEQQQNTANLPAIHADCAPLFMYLNKDLNDHFYTTNFKELLGGKLHYKFEGVMAGVYAVQHRGMIPVYRYFNDKSLTHMYTLNYNEWGKGEDIHTPEGDRGHTFEGVAFYVYRAPRLGLKPVYMWLDAKKDTMFSLNKNIAGPNAKGFKNVGVIGYGGCSPK